MNFSICGNKVGFPKYSCKYLPYLELTRISNYVCMCKFCWYCEVLHTHSHIHMHVYFAYAVIESKFAIKFRRICYKSNRLWSYILHCYYCYWNQHSLCNCCGHFHWAKRRGKTILSLDYVCTYAHTSICSGGKLKETTNKFVLSARSLARNLKKRARYAN